MKLSRPEDEHDDLILAFAVKAINDTLGPEGYVPSSLVYGEFPKMVTKSEVPDPRAALASRAKMLSIPRQAVDEHMAKLRVERALRHAVPPSADRPFSPGDSVLVWREKIVNNRSGEWVGPLQVTAFYADRKLVYVQEHKIGNLSPFSVAQVKRYNCPEEIALSFFSDIGSALRRQASPKDEKMILFTDIIQPNDPRAPGKEVSAPKKKELRGLLQRGTFKVILGKKIPPDANVLPGRFVLALKSTED